MATLPPTPGQPPTHAAGYAPHYGSPHGAQPGSPYGVAPGPLYQPPPKPKSNPGMTFLKVLGIAFGGLVVSCVAISVIFEDEIEAHSAEREEVANAGVEEVTARARGILEGVAQLDLKTEKHCPAELRNATLDYAPTSVAQLSQLAPDAGSTAESPGIYTSNKIQDLLDARAEDNKFDVADAVEALMPIAYVGVFVPEQSSAPKVVDRQSFAAGVFVGSVVIADFQAGKVLCHARFQAVSSESLAGGPGVSIGRGLINIPLTDMQDKADEDYRANFFASARHAVERIRLGSEPVQ